MEFSVLVPIANDSLMTSGTSFEAPGDVRRQQ